MKLKKRLYKAMTLLFFFTVIAGCSEEETKTEVGVDSTTEQFKQLEEEFAARLGVYVIDTETNRTITYRADERFAYTSTFKPFAAAFILQKFTISELNKLKTFTTNDLVTYSPITEKHVQTGMNLLEISEAAIQYSDNTAGNLLLEELGGPKELQQALRKIGDQTTSVDRYETELNEATPGDSRDTSTPRALAKNLQYVGLDEFLSESKKDIFQDWLKGNTTGDSLIRAGVPKDWVVGDKSGAGGYGTRNDIAIVWPPERKPIIMVIMSSKDEVEATYNDELIANTAKVIVETLK